MSKIPMWEQQRSTVSQIIGEAAEQSFLFLYNYEYRFHLDIPSEWGEHQNIAWYRGILQEGKYQSFRYDSMIGSYHPGQKAKWTSHELCHRLVGYFYNSQASYLEFCLAARLLELVPVIQFYFLEEIDLRRCGKHRTCASLFKDFCPKCEELAKKGPADNKRYMFRQRAAEFFNKELAAIKQSLYQKEFIYHIDYNINLCADAIEYTNHHIKRYKDLDFKAYMTEFGKEKFGTHSSLEALLHRVEEVFFSLLEEEIKFAPWQIEGVDEWVNMDFAYRLLNLMKLCSKDLQLELRKLYYSFCEQRNLEILASAYDELGETWDLPSWREFSAVGYDYNHIASNSLLQIREGLTSVFGSHPLQDGFENETWSREHLAQRYIHFLESRSIDCEELRNRYHACQFFPYYVVANHGEIHQNKIYILNPNLKLVKLTALSIEYLPQDVAALSCNYVLRRTLVDFEEWLPVETVLEPIFTEVMEKTTIKYRESLAPLIEQAILVPDQNLEA